MPKFEITFMDSECNVIGVMEGERDTIADAVEALHEDWIPDELPFLGCTQLSIMLKE